MWKRLDVDKSMQYQVALCQEPNGARRYALVPADSNVVPEDCVFLTAVVPYELLWWKDFEKISKTVELTNGKRFCTDAHGIWFTEQEMEALESDTPWQQVPWNRGRPPSNLPPK